MNSVVPCCRASSSSCSLREVASGQKLRCTLERLHCWPGMIERKVKDSRGCAQLLSPVTELLFQRLCRTGFLLPNREIRILHWQRGKLGLSLIHISEPT